MKEKPLLKEMITRQLRSQILLLQTDSYVKIASERELASQLNVSRISLRSAMKNLVEEGLLSQEQGKGTFIKPKLKLDSLHLLCSPDIKSNDPFFNQFLVEITNTAAMRSIRLSMIHPDQIHDTVEIAPLVIIGLIEESMLNKLNLIYKTIITILDGNATKSVTRIHFDDYQIGYEAARILIEHKHTHLIHLAGPDKYPAAFYRKKGFMDALVGSDVHLTLFTGKMNWPGGYYAGDSVYDHLISENPATALFAANDWMAVGLIQKLKERGISLPKQLSVIGCDDIPLASEFSPTLSTFQLDMKDLISELLLLINTTHTSEIHSNKNIMLPATFIQRESLIKL
jgi:DNA-binding LacI/PurR family transcriptional regulator/biotin operon repressor